MSLSWQGLDEEWDLKAGETSNSSSGQTEIASQNGQFLDTSLNRLPNWWKDL